MDKDTIGILASVFDHFSTEVDQAQDNSKPITETWRRIDTAVRRAHAIQSLDADLTLDQLPPLHECIRLFADSMGLPPELGIDTDPFRDHDLSPRRLINPNVLVYADRLTHPMLKMNDINIDGCLCLQFNKLYSNIILRLCATGDIKPERDLHHMLYVLRHHDDIRAAMAGPFSALNAYTNFLFGMLPREDRIKVTRAAEKIGHRMLAQTQHILTNVDEHYFLETPGLQADLADRVGLLRLPFEFRRVSTLIVMGPYKFVAVMEGETRIRGLRKMPQSTRRMLGDV